MRALWKELSTVQRPKGATETRAPPTASVQSGVRGHKISDPCYVNSKLDNDCLGCYTGNWDLSHHTRWCIQGTLDADPENYEGVTVDNITQNF